MTCGQVWCPLLGICALHLTHPSAHTQQWEVNKHTHTHCEHTPGAVGSQCCGAREAVGGSVPCSRVSPQSWYWGWRERWTFTPPTYNPCRTRDSNPQPSGYKSDSLSIRPWLPITTQFGLVCIPIGWVSFFKPSLIIITIKLKTIKLITINLILYSIYFLWHFNF